MAIRAMRASSGNQVVWPDRLGRHVSRIGPGWVPDIRAAIGVVVRAARERQEQQNEGDAHHCTTNPASPGIGIRPGSTDCGLPDLALEQDPLQIARASSPRRSADAARPHC